MTSQASRELSHVAAEGRGSTADKFSGLADKAIVLESAANGPKQAGSREADQGSTRSKGEGRLASIKNGINPFCSFRMLASASRPSH